MPLLKALRGVAGVRSVLDGLQLPPKTPHFPGQTGG
jgi:hypothetical protein